MKFGPQTIKSWLPYTHETIVGQQANTNITVDDGWHLSSGTSLPSIKEISESIHHCQAQKTGSHKPCCDVVILNENSRPGIFFLLLRRAPSRCGDHPTKSLRRIIQTQIKKNRATFRATDRGGWWSSRHERAERLLGRNVAVYTTPQDAFEHQWLTNQKETEGSPGSFFFFNNFNSSY